MKYRKKPVIVEATQWFKNGDHPDDDCHMVYPDKNSTSQFEPFLSEGKVVRYYRHPFDNGKRICLNCSKKMEEHGWLNTLEGGHIVCPGDWIVKEIGGNYSIVKPDIFEATYEEVKE